MNRRFTLLVLVVILASALSAGVAAAQGVPWKCYTDTSTYQICILRNGEIQIIYISSGGTGSEIGRFPRDLIRYAAATFEPQDVELLGRVANADAEMYAELYFVGESPAAVGAADDAPDRGNLDVYLTAVIYWDSGVRVLAVDFVYANTTSSAAVSFDLPYTEGEVPAAAGAAPVVPAPANTGTDDEGEEGPVSTTDLTIVAPGTEQTCLVRSTYTVRIRLDPTTNSAIVDRLPFGTTLRADLRTLDDQWLRVNYLGNLGWVNARYLDLTEACAGLNAISPVG